MDAKKFRVFVADDYLPMRQSLRKLLDQEKDFQVCGEANNVEKAYIGIVDSQPDVAIVDLILGGQTGLELLTRLGPRLTHLPVLVLSMLPESLNAQAVLDAGARGYIMKSESADQILTALRKVVQGRVYLSPAMIKQLAPTTKRRLP